MTFRQFAAVCALAGFAITSSDYVWAAAKNPPFVPQSGQAGKDVVWVPTPQALVDRMLDMAQVTPQDYLIDLGSGDGRTVITAAKRGVRAHGIEYNSDMVALAKYNADTEKVSEMATFVRGDIFKSDFSKATVITLFLLPELNVKLRPILLDMKPGTRVISNSFDMGDWKPEQTIAAGGDCVSWCTAYKWIVPAKVAGVWKMNNGELKLNQTYQTIDGTLTVGGKASPIANGRLDGVEISFTVGGEHYTGKVEGNAMSGGTLGGKSWSGSRT